MFMHTIGRPVETFIQFAGLMYGGIAERVSEICELRFSNAVSVGFPIGSSGWMRNGRSGEK